VGARLVTIPISHFCEKARWALDRAGVDYSEQPHVQLIHLVAARRAGGGRTVPVFVTDAGAVLAESSEILRWADARLVRERRLYPFLLGDRFIAADLAFAALAAPVLLPPRYGLPLPPPEAMPDAMAREVRRLRAHPAGVFADRVYAEERGRAAGAPA
jgi:glutathione S-transferase